MPRLIVAFSVAVAIGDDTVGANGDLGGLSSHLEVGQHTRTGLSHGPRVTLLVFVSLDFFKNGRRIDVYGVERDFVGVLRPYLLQAPQLGATGRSPNGEEVQVGGV